MVFADQRYSDNQAGRYTVIFVDSQSVLLESPAGSRNLTSRQQFEEAWGNRWQQVTQTSPHSSGDSAAEDQPDDDAAESVAPAVAVRSALTVKRESHASDAVGSSHIEVALEEIEQTLEPGCLAPVEFTTVDGIGEATAANLRSRDIKTKLDVQLAGDDYLTDVRGIGAKTLRNLRERVRVDTSD